MNVLALDSSGAPVGLAALHLEAGPGDAGQGDAGPHSGPPAARTLAVVALPEPRRLSRHIMSSLDNTVRRAGWTPDQIDLFAVGLGPGSWTGLRIGLSTVKTLAQVQGCALAGVPTFDAVAQAVWRQAWRSRSGVAEGRRQPSAGEHSPAEQFLLLAAAPCRPGEVYAQIFRCRSASWTAVGPARISSPQLLADEVTADLAVGQTGQREPGAIVVVGPAAPEMSAALAGRRQACSTVALSIEELMVEIGVIGAVLLRQGQAADPLRLQPLYLAPSAAERNLARPA